MPYMDFITTIGAWLIIYIVVARIVKKAGINQERMSAVINKTKKFQQILAEHTQNIKKLKKDKRFTKKSANFLKKDLKNCRIVDMLFNVYLFDHPNDKRVFAIRKDFSNVEVMLKDIIAEFLHNNETNDKIIDLEDKQKQINFICDSVCQRAEIERERQIDEQLHNI